MTDQPFRHPGFMSRVSGFTVAMVDWVKAGAPWRSPEETQELFDTHCRPCVHYDSEKRAAVGWPKGTCRACGCHVSDDAYQISNKVNKPTVGCPIGQWAPSVR